MSGRVGELLRTLKANPQRVDNAAATRVLAQARTEGASPAELSELSALLESALSDGFSPELREHLAAFVDGGGRPQPLDVKDLLPDLEVHTAPELAARFAGDFALLKAQLLAAGTPAEKVERLMEFLSAYAERFVALQSGEAKPHAKAAPSEVLEGGLFHSGPQPVVKTKAEARTPQAPPATQRPVPASERKDAVRQFARSLEDAGFQGLKDARTGRDGVAVGVGLVSSQNLAELKQRLSQVRLEMKDPQQWIVVEPVRATTTSVSLRAVAGELEQSHAKDRPRLDVDRVGARADQVRVQPWQAEAGKVVVQPVERKDRPEELPSELRRSNKVLGQNMLWNVLHTFREGGESEEEKKEQMERMAFGAVLLLVGIALVIVILVSL